MVEQHFPERRDCWIDIVQVKLANHTRKEERKRQPATTCEGLSVVSTHEAILAVYGSNHSLQRRFSPWISQW